jgi:DnaJ-domain-containing protein 1
VATEVFAPTSSPLARGELARVAYRLGRQAASGVWKLAATASRPDVLVLRRGAVVIGEGELAKRTMAARLARLASLDGLAWSFAGGVHAYPPGALHALPLAVWARTHLEAQLDRSLAEVLVRELAGVRLVVRAELVPEIADECDRRMLAAMARPRRLEQIAPLSHAPRFRLLALVHFLRAVGALELEGVVATRPDLRRAYACKLLGITDDADLETVKRAYRRLARALHPDLQPDVDSERRRVLEQKFAEVTAAYETLV